MDRLHAPPTGEQFELNNGATSAVVTEVGATLRSLTVGGAEVIDGFSVDERSSAGRGQVLAPWPNRLQDGTYKFEGRSGRAPLNEPEHGNAIHGLVRWMPWIAAGRDERSVELGCVVHPQPAYPWRLELSVRYALTEGGLEAEARATNASDAPAPFGIGFHPYVSVGVPADGSSLLVPASSFLPIDERGLPEGDPVAVDGGQMDFRALREIGSTVLDTAFTGLERDAAGVSRVRRGRRVARGHRLDGPVLPVRADLHR
jgi:galactose mutarotase-like enzyme